MEKRKLIFLRWLVVVAYMGMFLALAYYHLHMYAVSRFLFIILASTSIMVLLFWFLRDKKSGGRLTQKD